MVNCPKCGHPASIFNEKIHIYNEDNNFTITSLYGCEKCLIIFAIIDTINPQSKNTNDKLDKAQKILGNISKGCNSILSNIKT